MSNGNDKRLSNGSLETIPEEELPRISELIPKSPETRKREQEFFELNESHKQHLNTFCEMLIVQQKLKRIYLNEHHLMRKYADCSNINRPTHSSSPANRIYCNQ